jgi:hypothetical protein
MPGASRDMTNLAPSRATLSARPTPKDRVDRLQHRLVERKEIRAARPPVLPGLVTR